MIRLPPKSNRTYTLVPYPTLFRSLLGVALRKRTAEDGEILAEDEDQSAVDRARPGHHPVAGYLRLFHAEVDAIVLDVHVEFLERAFVEQHLQPLARGQPALAVLRVDAFLTAAHAGRRPSRFPFGTFVEHSSISRLRPVALRDRKKLV